MWAHRAFKAAWPLRLWWAVVGAGAWEGSVVYFVRFHRAHHAHVHTALDPYGGDSLLWQWMGWRLYATPEHVRRQDVSDVRTGDWVARWQHVLYVPIALGMTFGPAAVAVLAWGELPSRALFAMGCRMFAHQQLMALSQAAQTIRGRKNFSDFGRECVSHIPCVACVLRLMPFISLSLSLSLTHTLSLQLHDHGTAHVGRGLHEFPPQVPAGLPHRLPAVPL